MLAAALWSAACSASGAETSHINRQKAGDCAAGESESAFVLLLLIGLMRSVEKQRAAVRRSFARMWCLELAQSLPLCCYYIARACERSVLGYT